MSKKHLGIIAVVSVVVVCTASIGYIAYSGVWKDWIAGEWHNSYQFSISLDATEDLYNVTMYLPILMVKGKVSPLVYEINYPSNWTWNITDTEYGKMLKITADVIPKGYHSIGVSKEPNHTINTKNCVGNEPVLYPRYNETSVKHEVEISTKYEYQSWICTYYNSSNSELIVDIWMIGSKYRGILNAVEGGEYKDKIQYVTAGKANSWHKVKGTLEIIGNI